MRKLLFICLLSTIMSCDSRGKRPIAGVTEYQKKLNAQFKDASRSPLKKKDLKNFKGLDFFPVDSNFIVTAKIKRTPDAPFFEMSMTDGSKPLYREFGTVHFEINGKELSATLYQSKEELQDPRYRELLFLPFTDETSGEESYGGGRYMNLYLSNIDSDDTIQLNFNNTYNPYCVYNEKYSCPLVPRKNHIDIAIRAGIKDFKSKD